MKTKLLLLASVITIISSCSNPKDTAINLLEEFSNDLKKIENPNKISIYELDKQITVAVEKLNKNKDEELAELTKDEDIQLFENFFNIDKVKEYKDLVTILTNRNLQIIEQVKGKYWIETRTKHHYSIFMIDDNYFSFLNLKNKFDYQILNGSIICDNQKIFLEIKADHLLIFDKNGKKQEFEEPILKEKVLGKWQVNNGYRIGYIFNENSKGYYYGEMTGKTPLTYSITNNKIKTTRKINFSVDRRTFSFTLNRIKEDYYETRFYRLKFRGPQSISYLFDGNYSNPNEKIKKVKVSYSTNSSSKNWDKLLEDYEKYVNQYIKFYKKAQNGNMSALQEYPNLLKKAEKLQRSLEKAKNDNSLSVSQLQKLNRIQFKMLNAIQ